MEQDLQVTPAVESTSKPTVVVNTKKKNNHKVTWGITLISSVTLILTLLGYGVSLAVETVFGVPHQTIYSSALDLIGLSVYALISLALGLGKITWQPILEQAWQPSIAAMIVLLVLTCVFAFFRIHHARVSNRANRFWRYFTPPTKDDSTSQFIAKGIIASISFGAIVFVTTFLIIPAFIALIISISIVPMFGMQLGEHYFREFVVGPTGCEPVKSRDIIMKRWSSSKEKNKNSTIPVANCVTLLRDETKVATGRVVVSTPSAIVLFEPVSGSVWRIPTSGLSILPVSTVNPLSQP